MCIDLFQMNHLLIHCIIAEFTPIVKAPTRVSINNIICMSSKEVSTKCPSGEDNPKKLSFLNHVMASLLIILFSTLTLNSFA